MKPKLIALLLLCITIGKIGVQAQEQNNPKEMSISQTKKAEKNKQLVTTGYQRIFGELDTTAVDEFMSKDFLQHNPTIGDGPKGVKALVQMLITQGVPKQKIEFKHIIAEGDIVILHSRYGMAGKEWRFIDIYRVENNKIVEHWDAMMQMPEKRANNNPMF
jgi:predicted SnoaL-like aldol condensation-catalyzing enzyme